MHGLSVLLTSALAACATANPLGKLLKRGYYGSCLSASQAQTVADNFRATIAEPFSVSNVRAQFTKNFHDYSDSVIELIDAGCPNGPVPLGSATFASRKAFIQGQSAQQPITFNILNLWHNCDTVIIRWQTPNPGTVQPAEQVTGIIVIEVVQGSSSSEPWLINTVYSEVNSGAWLYDLGNFTPSCSSASKHKRAPTDMSAFMLPGRMA